MVALEAQETLREAVERKGIAEHVVIVLLAPIGGGRQSYDAGDVYRVPAFLPHAMAPAFMTTNVASASLRLWTRQETTWPIGVAGSVREGRLDCTNPSRLFLDESFAPAKR
jgi:hypothetical protein